MNLCKSQVIHQTLPLLAFTLPLPLKGLGTNISMYSITFEKQRQSRSLFGKLIKVCELQKSGITSHLSTLCLPDIIACD